MYQEWTIVILYNLERVTWNELLLDIITNNTLFS